jgi:hypothetical protein
MSTEPEGWHMDPTHHRGIQKPRRFPSCCASKVVGACYALSRWMRWRMRFSRVTFPSQPALARIFGAHRQLIELRAAQKLNAGLLESDGSVLVSANDI